MFCGSTYYLDFESGAVVVFINIRKKTAAGLQPFRCFFNSLKLEEVDFPRSLYVRIHVGHLNFMIREDACLTLEFCLVLDILVAMAFYSFMAEFT